MRRAFVSALACGTAALALTAPGAAGAVSYAYVTDTPAVLPAPGATFVVHLFLQETVTTPSSSLLVAENGLYGGGMSVTRTTTPASPASIVSFTANTTATGFPGGGFGSTPTASSGKASISESNTATAGGQPADVGSGVRRVQLFDLTLQAGTTPGQSTTFTLGQYGGTFNTLTHSNGYDLDVANTGTTHAAAGGSTFTVTTAPEPATAGLAAFALAGGLLRRRHVHSC